ncbi:MAG: hypothetical protein IKH70_08325, partial [Stomatobaculum sp.]|nr:hypothetical protein [Stomatobaculum sp.]
RTGVTDHEDVALFHVFSFACIDHPCRTAFLFYRLLQLTDCGRQNEKWVPITDVMTDTHFILK